MGRLESSSSLVLDAAYGQPPERLLVLNALAAFERSLLTPGAPFDRYLRGEGDAYLYR